MKEPWDFKKNDTREGNTKHTFIIFCEDGSVEPAYFNLFRSENLQISTIGNKKQHHIQVSTATEYCRQNDLLEINPDGNEILKLDEGAQVWCVFDRDRNPDDGKDSDFNDSITIANLRGIKTAWSNDDFELWILLHFEDVNPNNPEYMHRTKYYERLTDIIKDSGFDSDVIRKQNFDYYAMMKNKRRFLSITYQLMKSNEIEAIKRANFLEEFHNKTVKTYSSKTPCTMVHKLVQELRSIENIS
jgi:hypothetical protein